MRGCVLPGLLQGRRLQGLTSAAPCSIPTLAFNWSYQLSHSAALNRETCPKQPWTWALLRPLLAVRVQAWRRPESRMCLQVGWQAGLAPDHLHQLVRPGSGRSALPVEPHQLPRAAHACRVIFTVILVCGAGFGIWASITGIIGAPRAAALQALQAPSHAECAWVLQTLRRSGASSPSATHALELGPAPPPVLLFPSRIHLCTNARGVAPWDALFLSVRQDWNMPPARRLSFHLEARGLQRLVACTGNCGMPELAATMESSSERALVAEVAAPRRMNRDQSGPRLAALGCTLEAGKDHQTFFKRGRRFRSPSKSLHAQQAALHAL